jgi:hypothetical protein
MHEYLILKHTHRAFLPAARKNEMGEVLVILQSLHVCIIAQESASAYFTSMLTTKSKLTSILALVHQIKALMV